MTRRWSGIALGGTLVIAACWAAGCGGDDSWDFNTTGGDDGGNGDETQSFGEAGPTQGLDITPKDYVLQATGPGATVQYQAFIAGTQTPATVSQWTIDVAAIGTIDTGGLFSTSGLAAGKLTIAAQAGNLAGQTSLTVVLTVTDNPGNIGSAVQQQLENGGSADAAMKWLYPYDGTVFPRALLPPTLQFAGTPPDATYVHVSFPVLDYKGFYGPSNPGRVNFTPQLWKTITQSASGTDDVKVEITKISGGQVTGPITEKWRIAQGSLKGTVYYESRYSSQSDQGATMRIKPGAAQPDVLLGACTVCHSVSADGSTITADITPCCGGPSASYDLKNSAAKITQEPNNQFVFPALYPDGSILMSCAALPPSGSGWAPNVPGMGDGPRGSALYDTKTGAKIPAPGWDGAITYAQMPAFSPDGKTLAFNHYDAGQGHSLAIAQFDYATKTFSNIHDFVSDPSHFLGWPTFTPDSNWIVFHQDSAADYMTWGGNKADLVIAHLPSKTTALLDRLNGVVGGSYYLPFGEADEGHMNYLPTVLPEAVGGYYWVVFTTRREYGNTINTGDPYYNGDPRSTGISWRKKLWVAALDIDDPEHPSSSAHDISHPAFYLPGQDLSTGNYRGYWALDPCKQNGNSCEAGDECCSGFCRQVTEPDGAVDFVCVPPTGCAHEYEKCVTDADCCSQNPKLTCINGHCALPTPK